MSVTEYIQHHPVIALVVTVFHVVFAEWLRGLEIPLIIMQSAQLCAWAVTITVGTITINGFIKQKRKGKRSHG